MGQLSVNSAYTFGLRLLWAVRAAAGAFHRRQGRAGWVALASSVLAVGFAVALYLEQSQAERLLRNGVMNLQAAEVDRGREDDIHARLKNFDARLLPVDGVSGLLTDLLEAARRGTLAVASSEYRIEPEVVGRFEKLRFSWPVTGSSTALLELISEALGKHPSLGVEGLKISRNTDGVGVEARIDWVVYIKETAVTDPSRAGGQVGGGR
jgi:hypothetical protein